MNFIYVSALPKDMPQGNNDRPKSYEMKVNSNISNKRDWADLRNDNSLPFNLLNVDNENAFNDTEISPDIFNSSHMLPEHFTKNNHNDSIEASKMKVSLKCEYQEDNFRLKNQLIFANLNNAGDLSNRYSNFDPTAIKPLSHMSSSQLMLNKFNRSNASVVSVDDAKDKRRYFPCKHIDMC